ncbi:hypothetical protein [Corallococcus sp. CA054B]|uniref:hypothetical protein n=1 Tax=Corallococcus sp. CA054B TaxID=2316734 RepID=UPI001F20B769|nr:hypothetical protein [Corallococcus sp. CA054B]
MKYTFVFTAAAALLTFLAQRLQGPGWLLLWPALSFAVLALAYAGVGARAFGKQPCPGRSTSTARRDMGAPG